MPQAAQGGQNSDDALAPLWITAFIFITSFIVWYFNHAIIVRFIFKLDIYQAQLVNLLWPGEPLANTIQYIQTLNPELVFWNDLILITEQVGNYMRYIYGAVLIVLAFFLYQRDIIFKFCKVYTMNSLRAQEQENWPAICPVIKEDLIKADIDEGAWAMAMNPMEFSRKYRLLKRNDLLMEPSTPGQEMTASLKKGDAKRIFTMQLGPIWEGFDKCQPHIMAMSAIFLARINRDRDAANHIATQLSQSFAKGKVNYASAFPILEKYKNTELVQEVLNLHAYVYTVMASLLAKARDDGVVPSSEFLWLKPVDRRLWYMLNCVGRQTPYVEISGAFAHWKAEKVMMRPSLTPMIDEAVKALEIAIKEVKLSPKELQELPL
jgi:intracellular multiplication protein IcmP